MTNSGGVSQPVGSPGELMASHLMEAFSLPVTHDSRESYKAGKFRLPRN